MIIESDAAKKVISIILGLGLAALFRQVCNDERCKIVKGPSLREIEKNIYKIDERCYKYKPMASQCS
jgi:hypothetical protein